MTIETEFVKEILNNKEKSYSKTEFDVYMKKLLGDGLVTAEGEKWAKLRKLANHYFHSDSLKVSLFTFNSNSNMNEILMR